MFAGGRRQPFSGTARDRLGKIEQGSVFALAKILCLEKFWQADHPRTTVASILNAGESLLQVLFRLGTAGHLHQADTKTFRRQAATSPAMEGK